MTRDETSDRMTENLTRLQPLAPNPARAEHTRARCQAKLAQRRQRTERAEHIVTLARHVLAPAAVVGFSLLYVASLIAVTFRLRD